MVRRDRVIVDGVALACRIHSSYARARLSEALHDIALDAVHPNPRLTAGERDWLRAALARPIRIATEAALGTLSAELERALEDADIHVVIDRGPDA